MHCHLPRRKDVRAPRVEPRAAGGVIESYRRLSAGLVAGLRALGLAVAQVETADDKGKSAACFDAPSSYEITVGSKKLVGSAQTMNLQLILCCLSEHELALAEKLRREKYAAREWNLRA